MAPPTGSYLSRGGPGGHCRYLWTRVPPLAVSRLVVIRNYAQRSRATGPLGSDSISPDQWSRTRIYYPDPSAGREQTPRLEWSGAVWGVRSRHVSAGAGTRTRLPSFLGKTCPPTAFNAGDVKCALPQQSPRRLLPGCTVGRALPRCTVQPLEPPTPFTSVCYAS